MSIIDIIASSLFKEHLGHFVETISKHFFKTLLLGIYFEEMPDLSIELTSTASGALAQELLHVVDQDITCRQ